MNSQRSKLPDLRGKRVLVVDDEFLIAFSLEEALRDAGAESESASTVPMALTCVAEKSFSAAVLDVRIGRETIEPVADVLVRRHIPFIFYCGQALPDSMRTRYPGATVLIKPVQQNVLLAALADKLSAET
jgi:DNA-binding NtrC family response regulator